MSLTTSPSLHTPIHHHHMNVRPNMAGGLPAKPYVPPSGPAPPLPAGPPPPQPGYNQPQQDPAAAHAAAWAAYYQSQGLSATGQPQVAPGYNVNVNQPQPPAPNTSNPYANYGYGAQAAQAHLGQPSQRGSHRGGGGGGGPQQSYRPPPQQQYQYPSQGPPPHGYQSPTPYVAAPSQQQGYPVAGPQQPAWGQPGPGPGLGPAQNYRPPPSGPQFNQPGPPQQPAYFNNGPQQPYTPPHAGGQTPYRPSAVSSPLPMSQNRPYQAQAQGRPPRPPMNQGPTPPHHPPAKRPRFDGPGPGPGPPSGPALGGAPPSGPSGPPTRPSLPVRPGSMPARPPSGPRAPLPAPPIMRPPIHLGTGSAPPVFAPPGGPRGGSGPMRGMSSERGRGRGGGGGMVMNAPRGPSHMRRERNNDHRERDRDRSRRVDASPSKRDRKEPNNSTANNKKKENVKTTMTDFRIVGIEIKELGWTWGLTGSEAMNQAPIDVKEGEKTDVADEKKVVKVESESESNVESATPMPASTPQISENGNHTTEVPADVKEEPSSEAVEPASDIPETNGQDTQKNEAADEVSAVPADDDEGKVGAKRKAHSPEAEEGSSKKRSTYLLTHGKSNDAPSHESNQNRFRIYFESPPEADRIPQALRRNPYKRWRRASSSVAPSRQGEEADREKEKDQSQVKNEDKEDVTELPEVAEEDESAGVAAENGEPAQSVGEADAAATTNADEAPAQETEMALASVDTAAVEATVTESEGATTLTEPTESRAEGASVGPAPIESQTTEATAVVPSEEEPVNGTLKEAETMAEEPKADDTALPSATESVEQTAEPTTAAQEAPSTSNGTEVVEGEAPPTASQPSDATVDPASSAELTVALAKSAENAASAYKSRTRRRSSVSSTDSRDTVHAFQPEVTPSTNRLSILYEGSQRRMCFDAEVVEKIRVYREEGRIEVLFQAQPEDSKGEETDDGGTLLPKGFLLETYDQDEQRFAPVFREKLEELYSADDVTDSIPPLHRQLGSPTPPIEPLSINVYLNKKNPLSLPRWCRTNSADEWLFEQFGVPSKASLASQATWRGKLEVMDPDPPPTLANILENWATSSGVGSLTKRTEFTSSLLSEPYDLLEILLRLARGDRNPSLSTHQGSGGSGSGTGSSLTAAMRTDSPYASHQTHVSLAILAMYRLTTDYAAKAGEKSEVVNEKIGDIIKSLPSGMIARSLDGMFKEWDGKGKDKDKDKK